MTRSVPAALLLLLSATSAFAGDKSGEEVRFALVVGQNLSDRADSSPLRYADDDAVYAHLLFEQAGIKSRLLVTMDPESQRQYPGVKPDGPPTKEHLSAAFGRIRSEMLPHVEAGEVTVFYFFFSGHGNVDHGQGYLVLEGGRLLRSDFSKLVSRSPATQNHVIIDACKSYYMAFEKGPGGRRGPYPEHFVELDETGRSSKNGFILSTSSDRESHEWERYQSGVFSHEILSGLRGGADADGDGAISYAELGAFLAIANKGIANPRYKPNYFVRPPGVFPGDLARTLLRWPPHPSVLVVDMPKMGHFYVEDTRGTRLIDVHPEAGSVIRLHLPSRRPVFIRREGGDLEWVLSEPGPARLSEVPSRPYLRMSRKGALHAALERLFVEPFGPRDVAVYRDEFLRVGQLALSMVEAGKKEMEGNRIAVFERADRRENLMGVLKWTGLGLTLATAGAATVLGILAERDASAAREEFAGTPEWETKTATAQAEALAATITASIAGALAVGTLVFFLVDGSGQGEEDEDVGLSAAPVPGGAMAAVRIAF